MGTKTTNSSTKKTSKPDLSSTETTTTTPFTKSSSTATSSKKTETTKTTTSTTEIAVSDTESTITTTPPENTSDTFKPNTQIQLTNYTNKEAHLNDKNATIIKLSKDGKYVVKIQGDNDKISLIHPKHFKKRKKKDQNLTL